MPSLQKLLLLHQKHLPIIVMSTLTAAARFAPLAPADFEDCLRCCEEIPIPQSMNWFRTETERIVGHLLYNKADDDNRRWGTKLEEQIIRAAVLQIPATIPRNKPLWLEILRIRDLADFALLAFGGDISAQMSILQNWWNHDTERRQEKLEGLIKKLFKSTRKPANLRTSIKHHGAMWDWNLKRAANKAARRIGQQPFFPPKKKAKSK